MKGKKLLKRAILSIAIVFSFAFQADAKNWNCPDADTARTSFVNGDAKSWPYYTEAHAARVQRQHPETGLISQAKYIDRDERPVGICQYYSHIGLLFTFVAIEAEKGKVSEGSFWRKEWTESFPSQDKEEEDMMEVCMKTMGGAEWPSIGCSFEHAD